MVKASFIKRVIAAGISVVYFANCALAHLPETTLWAERKKSSSPNVSIGDLYSFNANPIPGRDPRLKLAGMTNSFLRNVLSPSASPKGTIYLIQDVHANSDAQTSIGRTVKALVSRGDIDFIGLEGAFDTVRIESFSKVSDRTHVDAMSDYFLKNGLLSGAVHAALSSRYKFPVLTGIDNEAMYDKNVEAYRASLPMANERRQKLTALENMLAEEKTKVFGPALRHFDEAIGSYHSGKNRIGEYLSLLATHTRVSPEVKNFLEAFELESTLDFTRVELDRRRWLQASDKSLARYPLLEKYVRYMQLSESLSVEKLFPEMRAMETAAYAALASSDAERALVVAARYLTLEKKLLNFSLTKEEWLEYKNVSSRWPGVSDGSFAEFYRQAEERDEAMAKNILATGARRGIVIAGGFHSSGISRRLVDAGYAVEMYVPRISKVDVSGTSAYLSAFAQRKAPLEAFFEGRKLFLPTPVKGPLSGIALGAATLSDTPEIDAAVILGEPAPELKEITATGNMVSAQWSYPEIEKTVEVNVAKSGGVVSGFSVEDKRSSGVLPASIVYVRLIASRFFEDLTLLYGERMALSMARIAGLTGTVLEISAMVAISFHGNIAVKIVSLILFLFLNFSEYNDETPLTSWVHSWFVLAITATYAILMMLPNPGGLVPFVALFHFVGDAIFIWKLKPSLKAVLNVGPDNQYSVRSARRSDIDAIMKIGPPRMQGNHVRWERARFRSALKMDQGLVVLRNNEIVGYAFYSVDDWRFSPVVLTIMNMAVDESYRRSGVGRLLMEQIEGQARKRGVDAIVCYLASEYTGSLSVLDKFGFEEGPAYSEGKTRVLSRVKHLKTENKDETIRYIEVRSAKREDFFKLLELLNRVWWLREEHVESLKGKEVIVDRGFNDKSFLEFFHNNPNPVAVFSWSENLLADANERVAVVVRRGMEKRWNGVSKFDDLSPQIQRELTEFIRKSSLGRFSLLANLSLLNDEPQPPATFSRLESWFPGGLKIDWRYAFQMLCMIGIRYIRSSAVKNILMRLLVNQAIHAALVYSARPSIAQTYRPGNLLVGTNAAAGEGVKEKLIERAMVHLLKASGEERTAVHLTFLRTNMEASVDYARRMLNMLQDHRYANEMTIPQFEGVANRLVSLALSEDELSDPYADEKKQRNEVALSFYEKARARVFLSSDLRRQLYTAFMYAALGDRLSVVNSLESREDSFEDISKGAFATAPSFDERDEIISFLLKSKGQEVLYFLNEHGEFYFDLLVVELLLKAGVRVTFVGRAELVGTHVTINDFFSLFSALTENPNTRKAAIYFRKEYESGRLRFVTDGSYLTGADLTRAWISPGFVKRWEHAIAFIAKGPGNWHTLFGQKLSRPGFFIRPMQQSKSAYTQLELAKSIPIEKRPVNDVVFVRQDAYDPPSEPVADQGPAWDPEPQFILDPIIRPLLVGNSRALFFTYVFVLLAIAPWLETYVFQFIGLEQLSPVPLNWLTVLHIAERMLVLAFIYGVAHMVPRYAAKVRPSWKAFLRHTGFGLLFNIEFYSVLILSNPLIAFILTALTHAAFELKSLLRAWRRHKKIKADAKEVAPPVELEKSKDSSFVQPSDVPRNPQHPFVSNAWALSGSHPKRSDIMEKAFEVLLEPFAFEPDRSVFHNIQHEREEVLKVLGSIFGDDHPFVDSLRHPDTYVIFMDSEIKRKSGDRFRLEVPHPDLVIVQLSENVQTKEPDLRFTFIDFKLFPGSVQEENIENGNGDKSILFKKSQIDPELARSPNHFTLKGLVRAISLHEHLQDTREDQLEKLQIYARLIMRPIFEKFPNIDFREHDPSFDKGFFITANEGPIPTGFDHDEFLIMNQDAGEDMIIKYAFGDTLVSVAKLFGVEKAKGTAQHWLATMPKKSIFDKIIKPALAIATLSRAIVKKDPTSKEMRPISMDSLNRYLERAVQLIEHNDLRTPVINSNAVPTAQQIKALLDTLAHQLTPRQPSVSRNSLSLKKINAILNEPAEKLNVIGIDGKQASVEIHKDHNVLVLINKDSLVSMTAHIDAMLAAEVRPAYILIFSSDPSITNALKKRYSTVKGTKVSVANRRSLFEKQNLTLQEISEEIRMGRPVDKIFNALYLPVGEWRLSLGSTLPEDFTVDLRIIIAAQNASMVMTSELLRKTDWQKIRDVLGAA